MNYPLPAILTIQSISCQVGYVSIPEYAHQQILPISIKKKDEALFIFRPLLPLSDDAPTRKTQMKRLTRILIWSVIFLALPMMLYYITKKSRR